jgi:hypothetical protein
MKQNSSILFHPMGKSLKIRCRAAALIAFLFLPVSANAAEKVEYLASYAPAKGFKPAQRDLTEIFLQLAGSLEVHGSPEPYLRHVAAEHYRVETLYRVKFGKNPQSFRPTQITDAHLDRFSNNWKVLAGQLPLEPWVKEFGHLMRDALLGTRGTGTVIVKILNRHQQNILDAMSGKGERAADFESLRTELVRELELDKKTVEEGKYEVARRDAVSYAIIIHGITTKLFEKIDAEYKHEDAERIKAFLTKTILNTAETARSELQAGISERAFGKLTSARN